MFLDTCEDPGSDTTEQQMERPAVIKTPQEYSPRSRNQCEDDIMIITPQSSPSLRKHDISDDEHYNMITSSPKRPKMNGRKQYKEKYGFSDSDDDNELTELVSQIGGPGLQSDARFCAFANDNHKCYRNSLIQVLISCDMLLQSIRTHKQVASLPPCSEFDDFLLQIHDQAHSRRQMSIDSEFNNHPCLKVRQNLGGNYTDFDQSPADYLSAMFAENEMTTQVTKNLMSYRMLNSVERTNNDGSVTWRTTVLENNIYSESCKVIDETGFNNIKQFNIQASGLNMDAIANTVNIVMELPKIWCIDCNNNEKPIFDHQFTITIPQMIAGILQRAVYQIIGCLSHNINQQHYVACIYKNKKWVCMVCFQLFIQKI
jgi:hypothetical protein